jgi:hypothetical protein
MAGDDDEFYGRASSGAGNEQAEGAGEDNKDVPALRGATMRDILAQRLIDQMEAAYKSGRKDLANLFLDAAARLLQPVRLNKKNS